MATVSALFDRPQDAAEAVRALKALGIRDDEISVVAQHSDEAHSHFGDRTLWGMGLGAGVGAAVGALAIPGLGPVVGGGWLLAAALGAAVGETAGGVVGALTEAGVEKRDAHVYAEGVKRGGTLVTARVDAAHEAEADAILHRHDRVDIVTRRAEWEESGWSGRHEHH